jgi:hypothetical protein
MLESDHWPGFFLFADLLRSAKAAFHFLSLP